MKENGNQFKYESDAGREVDEDLVVNELPSGQNELKLDFNENPAEKKKGEKNKTNVHSSKAHPKAPSITQQKWALEQVTRVKKKTTHPPYSALNRGVLVYRAAA